LFCFPTVSSLRPFFPLLIRLCNTEAAFTPDLARRGAALRGMLRRFRLNIAQHKAAFTAERDEMQDNARRQIQHERSRRHRTDGMKSVQLNSQSVSMD